MKIILIMIITIILINNNDNDNNNILFDRSKPVIMPKNPAGCMEPTYLYSQVTLW